MALFPEFLWIGAHMGGDPEHADHLERDGRPEALPHFFFLALLLLAFFSPPKIHATTIGIPMIAARNAIACGGIRSTVLSSATS